MLAEVRINVAARTGIIDLRGTESSDIGFAGCDADWDSFSGEEPKLDEIRCPLHGIDTTFICVEVVTIIVGLAGAYGTTA